MRTCLLVVVCLYVSCVVGSDLARPCIYQPCPDLSGGCEEVYSTGCCDVCAKKLGEPCGGRLLTRCQTGLVCSKGPGTVTGQCVCGPPCVKSCPYGRVLDHRGCPACECNKECPYVKCIPCPYGYLHDSNGCNRCACRPKPCKRMQQREIYCTYGVVVDEYECELYKCKQKPCKPLTCDLYCSTGYAVDGNGCKLCKCKPKRHPVQLCKPVTCGLNCLHGFVVDKHGCEICECKSGKWEIAG